MKIFSWPEPWVKYAVLTFVIAFFLLVVRECRAIELVEAGVGTTFSQAGQYGAGEISAITDNGRWEASAGYLKTDKNTVKYLGASRVAHIFSQGDSPFLFLGGVYTEYTGPDYYLSRKINFYLGGGVELFNKNASIEYKHISNAGTSMPNRGVNFVLVNWRFK